MLFVHTGGSVFDDTMKLNPLWSAMVIKNGYCQDSEIDIVVVQGIVVITSRRAHHWHRRGSSVVSLWHSLWTVCNAILSKAIYYFHVFLWSFCHIKIFINVPRCQVIARVLVTGWYTSLYQHIDNILSQNSILIISYIVGYQIIIITQM